MTKQPLNNPSMIAQPREGSITAKPLDDDAKQKAQAAIAAGVPKEEVIQRLKEAGYDTSKF